MFKHEKKKKKRENAEVFKMFAYGAPLATAFIF